MAIFRKRKKKPVPESEDEGLIYFGKVSDTGKPTPDPVEQRVISQMVGERARHNPRQQLITADEASQRTVTDLVAAAGDNVPALVQAVGTIATRFEQFVTNIHALNVGLQEFKRDVMVPFREELKYLRYTTGDRLNHASSDLEKYVAKLDQVLWGALRATGMSDDAIRRYREENGMQPETPRGQEIEDHMRQVQALHDTIEQLTQQNQRLIASAEATHQILQSDNGWVWRQSCKCSLCKAETARMAAAQQEVLRRG